MQFFISWFLQELKFHQCTLLKGGNKSKNQCLQKIEYTLFFSKWLITLEKAQIDGCIALNLLLKRKFNYSRPHVNKQLISPTQKNSQCIQLIETLADFTLNLWEYFASLPYCLGAKTPLISMNFFTLKTTLCFTYLIKILNSVKSTNKSKCSTLKSILF